MTWPQIQNAESKSADPICQDALTIAKAQFEAEDFYLHALIEFPDDISSKPVLVPHAFDISGGDALHEDEAVFQKILKDREKGIIERSIYWQITPHHDQRFVVNEQGAGWRGDRYMLFTAKSDISPEEFIDRYNKNLRDYPLDLSKVV